MWSPIQLRDTAPEVGQLIEAEWLAEWLGWEVSHQIQRIKDAMNLHHNPLSVSHQRVGTK